MNRGDVVDVRLDPVEGHEQAGTRPVVVVSRDALHQNTARFIGVPCTTYRGRHIYPTNVFLQRGEGGLEQDTIALCDQVRALSKTRIVRERGALSARALADIDQALAVALDFV